MTEHVSEPEPLSGSPLPVRYFSFTFGTKNPARTGAGIGLFAPFTERQITSLNSKSSAASSFSKSNVADIAAPHASRLFFSFRSTAGLTCLYAVRSGFAKNEAYIGRAAASNWLIGFSPRISSIVRSMLLVEYMVEST